MLLEIEVQAEKLDDRVFSVSSKEGNGEPKWPANKHSEMLATPLVASAIKHLEHILMFMFHIADDRAGYRHMVAHSKTLRPQALLSLLQ